MAESAADADQMPDDVADMFSEVPDDDDALEVVDVKQKKGWVSSALGWVGSGVSKVAGKLGLANSIPHEDPVRLSSIL